MEDYFSGNGCFDTLYVFDAEWNLAYEGCVDGDEPLSISVPGELAIFTVTSDGSGLSSYQIDSFTANMP
jgi:hypothetical protein